ncbi:MAG: segregation/condensation protein A [Anaerolineae bacterium]|nr:segregation/condensation protein A [Chloroflexi bacterium CFX1]MCQ3946471.1 segregation/condensation protein A [Anaerolineae bacterium]RIK25329.1 MAG: segregation/condensation protein A [Anaerolineae bacterium]
MLPAAQSSYTVAIPVYEGPLALLLDLIERAELDITAVSLAQVTDQYLAYVHSLEQVTADEISSFLVIAAKLIQIKSEALLPRPPAREAGEENPADDLARQLRLYKRYKEIGMWLEERQSKNLRTFLRVAPPPKVEAKLDLSGITLADLLESAERIFAAEQEKQSLGTVIAAPRITIREKIELISTRLRLERGATFRALLGEKPTRLEIVVTFLALLELVKRYRVQAQQEALFSDIAIQPLEEFQEGEEFDLEFE